MQAIVDMNLDGRMELRCKAAPENPGQHVPICMLVCLFPFQFGPSLAIKGQAQIHFEKASSAASVSLPRLLYDALAMQLIESSLLNLAAPPQLCKIHTMLMLVVETS